MAYTPNNINGQATSANSAPVVIASDQPSFSVSPYEAELALPVGMTSLRDRTVAQRYTVWGDSIADGVSPEWVQTTANGGTVTNSGGEGLLQTSASATGSAQIVGPIFLYLPGQVDWVNSAIRMDAASTGNTRRWGRFTISAGVPQDGFAFELIDLVFYATTFKGGVATRVASTSWTKFSTAPYTLDLNYLGAEIRFTTNACQFYINNVLRHTASGGASAITNTLNLPIAAQNINSSGATNRVLYIRNIGQGRFGTAPNGSDLNNTNSTSTTLAISGVFTGTPIDITYYEKVTVTVFSNVASATDGLSLQQSTDGTNWDLTDTYTIPAATGKTFSVPKQARYFRVVYTNGGTIQASFRLQTLLSIASKASSNRATDAYSNETDLEQNQTFPMIYNGTTWDRARGDISNGLDVDVTRLPALAAGTNAIGKLTANSGVVIGAVEVQPVLSGGWGKWSSPKDNSNTPITNTVVTVRGTQIALGGYMIYNPNAVVTYIQCFDAATATTITLGTTRPDWVITLPPTAAANLLGEAGIGFTNGLKIAATTSDSGSTAPTSGLTVSLAIK